MWEAFQVTGYAIILLPNGRMAPLDPPGVEVIIPGSVIAASVRVCEEIELPRKAALSVLTVKSGESCYLLHFPDIGT
jgi:hypothetical protein